MAMRRAMGAVVALFLVALTWVAIWVPFHATDALIYGRWSRMIELGGPVADLSLGAGYLQRPLVYVVQGWLWELFGFHEWIGRLWALLFLLGLVWAVWKVAGADRGGAITGAIGALLLVCTPDVVQLGAAGLTDVPVAATAAVAGVLVLGLAGPRNRWALAGLIVTAAILAGLAKPSSYFALLGVGLALFIGPRAQLRERLLWRGVPLATGTLLSLVWAAIQAGRLDLGLSDFLRGGSTETISAAVYSFYDQLNAQSRSSFILGMEWLGPYLTLPLIFAIVYAALRLAARSHRLSATIAAPTAIVLSGLLPFLADTSQGAVGPYDLDRPIAVVATVALFVPLWLSRDCPEEDVPTRGHLARMVVWALPPTLAWISSAPFNTRYLSPAWAPLIALIAATLWMAMRGVVAARGARWGWAVVAVLLVVGVVDLRNLDGLGQANDGSIDAARTLRELKVTGWFHPDQARAAADPGLGALVADTGAALRTPGRLLTGDGRLSFYWPTRTTRGEPQRCADLRGYRTLVVTQTASGLAASREKALTPAQLAAATGGRATQIDFWPRCQDPRVRTLAIRPREFAVFRVGP
jgi:4-amino-4-deoxy-L-arabinose transferase-like glycosyltransferase